MPRLPLHPRYPRLPRQPLLLRSGTALALVATLAALAGCDGVTAPQDPGASPAERQSATSTFTHAGLTTTCIGCHLADRPNGVIQSYVHTYAKHGQDDCVECHTQAGATWSGAYHQHLPFAGIQCATCHLYDRPSSATYPDGTVVAGHFGTQDCVSCHLPQLTQTYTPFTYSHTDVFGNNTQTCLPCHQQEGVKAHGANIGECAGCHNQFGTWAGASATPTPVPSPSTSASPAPAGGN